MPRTSRALPFRSPLAAALLGALVVFGAALAPARAALGERVIADPATGIAIGGHDPVAYFVDERPRLGSPLHEADWAGVTWRFVNEGNRAAFLAAPQVYAPRFGGHSAMAVARGFSGGGDPTIWLIHDGRLYFFLAERQKRAFARDADDLAREAGARWPALADKLVP